MADSSQLNIQMFLLHKFSINKQNKHHHYDRLITPFFMQLLILRLEKVTIYSTVWDRSIWVTGFESLLLLSLSNLSKVSDRTSQKKKKCWVPLKIIGLIGYELAHFMLLDCQDRYKRGNWKIPSKKIAAFTKTIFFSK